jgi:hydroxymethylbilane synthase
MSQPRIVIATRQSKLALWQANFIRARLETAHPGLCVELLGMTTAGDRWLSSPLSEVGGKGLFVKALEDALLAGRADIAVHSMKDVPATLPEAFVLPVIGFRADVRDALVLAQPDDGPTTAEPSSAVGGLAGLPEGAVVGSSSLRRQAMLRAQRPDLEVRPVRGNVGTRLDKLDAGEFAALLLAAAGLERLGLGGRISEYLPVDVFLPAAGQGALGIECRADDARVIELISVLDDPEVSRCVSAERLVSAGLGADCSAPLGAAATLRGELISLRAVLSSVDGTTVLRASASHRDPAAVSSTVVGDLLAQGGRDLLSEVFDAG